MANVGPGMLPSNPCKMGAEQSIQPCISVIDGSDFCQASEPSTTQICMRSDSIQAVCDRMNDQIGRLHLLAKMLLGSIPCPSKLHVRKLRKTRDGPIVVREVADDGTLKCGNKKEEGNACMWFGGAN